MAVSSHWLPGYTEFTVMRTYVVSTGRDSSKTCQVEYASSNVTSTLEPSEN